MRTTILPNSSPRALSYNTKGLPLACIHRVTECQFTIHAGPLRS